MKKPKFGAGTARISSFLRHRKPELLLTGAALLVFALIWGADAFGQSTALVFPAQTTAPVTVQEEAIAPTDTTPAKSGDSVIDDALQVATPTRPPTRASTKATGIATIPPQTAVQTIPPAPPTVPIAQTVTPTVPASHGTNTQKPTGKVNVNTASVVELQALPGIGPTKAQAIADYRAAHGAFLSPEDLLGVKGIGKATLDKLRPYLLF
ncbi:MAG: helix-hairpin-helix domain-containing protein [Oscillospiraceae bacterium]|nr:helix-hairpin-helix domain-containing protein [Oscillospiraceae bacterium]